MAKISLGTGAVITGNEKKWSPLQEAIYHAVENTDDNLLIQARAGSGKTTTLVECARRLPKNKRILFAAFNKAIVTELSNRLPLNVDCRTLHSLAFELCKRGLDKFTVSNNWKVSNVLAANLDTNDAEQKDFYFSTRKIYSALLGLIKANNMQAPVSKYIVKQLYEEIEMEPMPEFFYKVYQICEKGFFEPLANGKRYEIDFDDMLYMAVNTVTFVPMYDVIFIDEAQDISPIQRELLVKLLVPGGRVIVAGDSYQAIYAFRGASYNSLDLFKAKFSCIELPLSISYRCPSKVIKEARRFVSDIESFSGTGSVSILPKKDLANVVETGSLVLCRYNAPLADACLSFLKAGKPAYILGDEVANLLLSHVEKIEKINKRPCTKEDIVVHNTLLSNFMSDGWKKDRLKDITDTLLLIASSNLAVQKGLTKAIEHMFADKEGAIICSTIHKAKGREAKNVFLLNPESMPCEYASSFEQIQQENNLIYVSITRALENLYYISDVKEWSWRKEDA